MDDDHLLWFINFTFFSSLFIHELYKQRWVEETLFWFLLVVFGFFFIEKVRELCERQHEMMIYAIIGIL